MKYDFAGRMTFDQFGLGLGSDNQTMKRVYQQTISYDSFSMMTTRSGVHWDNEIGFNSSYTNGRLNNNPNAHYDAAGNIAYTDGGTDPHSYGKTYYDASGRRIGTFTSEKGRQGGILNMVWERLSEYVFDGDGRPVAEKFGWQSYHINDPVPPPLVSEARTYQIWSTVLGSSLTTVTPDGNKKETKVFAGGAVIAKQSRFVDDQQQVTDGIQWTTTDPVTGTQGRFGYGSAGGTFVRVESEPLGQTISSWDPNPDPPPSPVDEPAHIGEATDAEWQCKAGTDFYGGLIGMPFHCQKAIFMDLSHGLSDIVWVLEEEDNPKKIAAIDSPIPGFSYPSENSPSRNALAFAMSSTSKQSVYGEDSEDEDDGCNWDKDGKPDCVVKADGFDMSIISDDFMDASSPFEILANFLDESPGCAGLLGVLLALTGQSRNLADLPIVEATGNSEILNQTLRESGISGDDDRTFGEYFNNDGAEGITSLETGRIFLGPNYSNVPSQHQKGVIIFHELLHSLFRAGHAELGKILGIMIPPSLLPTEVPKPEPPDIHDFSSEMTKKRRALEYENKKAKRQRFIDNALIGGRITAFVENDCNLP